MSIRSIRILSLLIMIAAGATSYLTQRSLFLDWRVDAFTASVAPISIDLLAVICTVALHHPEYTRKGRVVAAFVLVMTGSGSVTSNWIAGGTVGAKFVHAGMVGLYLLAEWVASQKEKEPVAEARTVVMVQDTELGTESPVKEIAQLDPSTAPVSPAVGGPAARGPRGDYGGRSGPNRDEYAASTLRKKSAAARKGQRH
jgi:hypothetical protein